MGKLTDIQIRSWTKAGKPITKADEDGLTFTLSAAGGFREYAAQLIASGAGSDQQQRQSNPSSSCQHTGNALLGE